MKSIKNVFILLISVLIFISCSNVSVENPNSEKKTGKRSFEGIDNVIDDESVTDTPVKIAAIKIDILNL